MRQRGVTFVEVSVVVVALALAVAMVVPEVVESQRKAALQGTALRLRGLVYRCRAWAIMHGCTTALVFDRTANGGWRCFIAEDGDGDGVLSADLRRGQDRLLGEVLELEAGAAGPGILRTSRVPDPSGDGWLGGRMDDPIRAGPGNIISFGPGGTATPSSVYLTDHIRRMRVLRIYGPTARVHMLGWQVGQDEWRREVL